MRDECRPLKVDIRLRRQAPQTGKSHGDQRHPRSEIRRTRRKEKNILGPMQLISFDVEIIVRRGVVADGFCNRVNEQRGLGRDAGGSPDEFLGRRREIEVPLGKAYGGEEYDEQAVNDPLLDAVQLGVAVVGDADEGFAVWSPPFRQAWPVAEGINSGRFDEI